jgi:hypothetical protein
LPVISVEQVKRREKRQVDALLEYHHGFQTAIGEKPGTVQLRQPRSVFAHVIPFRFKFVWTNRNMKTKAVSIHPTYATGA